MPKSHEDLGKDSVLVKGKCPKNVMMCIYKFFHYFINFMAAGLHSLLF